jgi:hypothetical protein
MIRSAEIRNFRGFKQLELSNLARINLVVGDNGSGKTALLEALFLASGSTPELVLCLRGWRGAEAPRGTGTLQELYDGLFLDLFRDFHKDSIPTISLKGDAEDSRALRFYYDRDEPSILPLKESVQTQSLAYVPITFEWQDAAGQKTTVTPHIEGTGLSLPPPPPLRHESGFLAARVPIPTSQNARWFSEFSKRGREKKFIATIRAQFESVESMSVEVDMGNPVIFVKLPWLDRKMPIYLASDGLNKLVTLLLHIAHCRGAAVFVDEVENGFHFSRHERLWEQLLSFAEEYETQLFLSTHSWEYLKALSPLIERLPHDFAMIQVFQDGGVGSAMVVSGPDTAAAIESGFEVRR